MTVAVSSLFLDRLADPTGPFCEVDAAMGRHCRPMDSIVSSETLRVDAAR
ncbi:hypothetical protein [Cupriavidus sp. 8B]